MSCYETHVGTLKLVECDSYIEFIKERLDSPENSWVFRVTFAFNPFTSWDHIDMICDFIQEDIEDCGNSKYWPGFKI